MPRERGEGRQDGQTTTHNTHNGDTHAHILKTHMERKEEGERKRERERERDKGKTEQREKYNRDCS
jgi:hypothetical protein